MGSAGNIASNLLNPISALENTLSSGDPSGQDFGGKEAGRENDAVQASILAEQIRLARQQQQRASEVFGRSTNVANELANNQIPAQRQRANRAALSQENLAARAGGFGQLQANQGRNLISGAQQQIGGLSSLQALARQQPGIAQAFLPALAQQSAGQAGQAQGQANALGRFAQGLTQQGGAPTGTANALAGLSGLAQSQFGRGATDINPQIAALQQNAAQIAQGGQQEAQELSGLRSQGLGALNQILGGRTPSSLSNLFDQSPASRDTLERQFQRAQQNVTERTGQRGGALSRELAGLEAARATAVSQEAAQRDAARRQFEQGLFATGLQQGLAAPGQQQAALGLSSNILQGAGQQQLGAEQLRQSALGQATGAQQAAGGQLLQGAGLQQGNQGLALQGLQAALQGQLGVGGQNLAALSQSANIRNTLQNQLNQSIGQQAQLQNQAFNQQAGLGQNLQNTGNQLQFQTAPGLQNQGLASGQVGIEAILSQLAPFTGQLSNTAGSLGAAAQNANQIGAAQSARSQALGTGLGTLVGAFFGGPVGAAAGGAVGGSVGGGK